MSVQEKLLRLLVENGYPVEETNRSLVTTCPQCSKQKHLYIFREGERAGWAKCMKCGTSFSPEALTVAITGCTFGDARKVLNAGELIQANETLSTPLGRIGEQKQEFALQSFMLPSNFFPIEQKESQDGLRYLQNRGVQADVLKRFDIRYCPSMERVIFPVYMDGVCTGYQGRDITGQSELRYSSPSGFAKSRVLFGFDQIDDTKDYLILTEGPIDALRVAAFFPVVCSMGKMVSQSQIELIKGMGHVKRLYLGLDPDAFDVFDKIAAEFEPLVEVYIYQPPEGVKDFGEASDRDILLSFKNAKRYNKSGALYSALKK